MHSFIFIPIEKTEEANALAVLLAQGTDANPEAQRATFGGLRLSPTGQEPATHTACEIVLSEGKRKAAREAVESLGGEYLDDVALWGDEMKMILSFDDAEKMVGLSRIHSENEI